MRLSGSNWQGVLAICRQTNCWGLVCCLLQLGLGLPSCRQSLVYLVKSQGTNGAKLLWSGGKKSSWSCWFIFLAPFLVKLMSNKSINQGTPFSWCGIMAWKLSFHTHLVLITYGWERRQRKIIRTVFAIMMLKYLVAAPFNPLEISISLLPKH